jgi:hypothetical protein
LVTEKGRTIPIAYDGYELGNLIDFNSQNKIEEEMLKMIIEAIPEGINVIFIADRGFDRPEIPELFIQNKVKFVIRASTGVTIQYKDGTYFILQSQTVKPGEMKDFGTIFYTKTNPIKLRFVGVWDKGMKEAWYLLTNIYKNKIEKIIYIYSRRMEIEEMFKSKKNSQCGFSWKHAKITTINRWLVLAFIVTLLFQFLALIVFSCEDWKKYENRYTLCRRINRVFSIYSLAKFIFRDYEISSFKRNLYKVSMGMKI